MVKEVFFEILVQVLSKLNLRQISSLGKAVGTLMWILVPSRRKMAITNIENHLKINRKDATYLAKMNFLHTGRAFVEIFYNLKVDYRFVNDFVEVKNESILKKVKSLNRPVVAVTAHLGSWELLAGIMAVLFQDIPTQIVIREPGDPVISEIVKRLRGKCKHEIVPRDNSAPRIAKLLKRNGISAFLVDHNCGWRKAIFLPFLGEIAAVNFGPALMALRNLALVLPVFLIRGGKKGYKLYFLPYLDTRQCKGNLKEKVKIICEFYTKVVEEMVLKYPEQWYWIHNRWRTKPKKRDSKKELL